MKKIDALVKKLCELEDQRAEAQAKLVIFREKLLTLLQENGYDHAETIHGKITVGHRTKYKISAEMTAELKKLKEHYDFAKKDAEAQSEAYQEPYLIMTRPKDTAPPTTYVSKKVKMMKKGKVR